MALVFSPDSLAAELAAIDDPWELLRRGAELAPPGRAAIGTSGQLTGTALIEAACAMSLGLRVFTIDTLRLFPETLDYFDALERHYRIKIERHYPDESELRHMLERQGTFLFFESKAKQEFCCEIRKVRPNHRALATVDLWFTGLRRDQSEFRKDTPKVQIVETPVLDRPGEIRRAVKVAPLADWSEDDVRAYLQQHKAPIHPLLEESDSQWFFESLGCVICTTRQARWEPARAGRWRWFNNDAADRKECGIHLPPAPQFPGGPKP